MGKSTQPEFGLRRLPRAPIVGVEHEYYLRSDDEAVDFRELIDGLGLDGRRIDPADQRAYRLTSGHVITCDDAEAECVIAPVQITPGFTQRVDRSCRAVAGELGRVLPASIDVVGASTHVSVSCPDIFTKRVASMIAAHYAPSLMLLADDSRSYGLLVRPRFGRVEFGLDYVNDEYLRAVVAMAVGSVATCLEVLTGRSPGDVLPPRLEVKLARARRRYGLYISRRSFRDDLYRSGRLTRLATADGTDISAGTHLELAWKSVRPVLEASTDPSDFIEVDDLVAGTRPLPLEGERSLEMLCSEERVDGPFTGVLTPVERPGFRSSPIVLSWDLAVFAISGRRRAFAAVPRDELGEFGARLGSGELDESIEHFLAEPCQGRAIPAYPQAVQCTRLYDWPGSRSRLVTPERARNGQLELEDGTVLNPPRLSPPSRPGIWVSSIVAATPGEGAASGGSESLETESTSSESSSTEESRRSFAKVPIEPPEDGTYEDPPIDDGWFGFSWRWLVPLIAILIVIAAGAAVAATGGGFIDFWSPATTTTTAVAPTTTSAVAPTTTTAVAPTTTSAVAPTTTSAVAPTTTSAVAPTTTSAVAPTTTSAVAPTTTSAVAPTTTSAVAPTTTAVAPTTTAAPATGSKSHSVAMPCPNASSSTTILLDIYIPMGVIGPSHSFPDPPGCADTTFTFSAQLIPGSPEPGRDTYRITIGMTGGPSATGGTDPVTATVTWTNP